MLWLCEVCLLLTSPFCLPRVGFARAYRSHSFRPFLLRESW